MQCKQVIYNLIALESKHESLHLTNVGQRSKGQKREEQYKIVWNELETLLKNNCHSDNHKMVYNCLIECHKFNADETDKVELDQALRELDQMAKSDSDVRASVIRATTDSPMSPPPLTSIASPMSRNNIRVFPIPADNKLDIFIKHPKYNSRPLENGSGAEKTLAAMAIRIALMNVTNLPKPNIFILDEPGTALDNDNMEGFTRILDLIKNYFDITILISHIDQLKDAVDTNIEISRNDGYAYVKC